MIHASEKKYVKQVEKFQPKFEKLCLESGDWENNKKIVLFISS